MKVPLEDHQEVDTGAPKDADRKRSPDKYFWGVLDAAIAFLFIAAVFYWPTAIPYKGVARAAAATAFLAIAITTIVRSFSR